MKDDFIRFLIDSGVLRFGRFKTKSGRITPYFINTGAYKTGEELKKLGEFYASCYMDNGLKTELLYGPAYKGIPLVVTASIALSGRGFDKEICFNRKESKDHGEGGSLIGADPDGKSVTILEDVITAGTSVRESIKLLKNSKVDSLIVSVDRMEVGSGGISASEEIKKLYGITTYSIVTILDIIDYLKSRDPDQATAIMAYLEKYGIKK